VAQGFDDTELCADESGCDRVVYSRALCKPHHQKAWSYGTLPPKFKIHRKGHHGLAETRPDGRRWCVRCGYFVKVYSMKSKDARGVAATCRERMRTSDRAKVTGWSQLEYDLALIEQGNRCALCGRPPSGEGLHADHDHDDLRRRGLLCRSCNTALGMFQDDPELMRRAASYVEGGLEIARI
jgi:hypothetical protein